MFTYLIISIIASLGWLIKDCIQVKSAAPVKENWKKYVGCLVGGLIYGLLSGLSFFRWIATIGVIALVANSFSVILIFLNWLIRALGFKKASI